MCLIHQLNSRHLTKGLPDSLNHNFHPLIIVNFHIIRLGFKLIPIVVFRKDSTVLKHVRKSSFDQCTFGPEFSLVTLK